ncbi:hypothetical protein HY990_04760 [Candidatus Micrarchaeota archaeon]|nr:hypothetical protein [Candidatus Micrarchaeota archaeon]
MKTEGKGTAIALSSKKSSGKIKTEKDQLIVVIEGNAKIAAGKEVKHLKKEESIFVAKGTQYEITNEEKDVLIYVIIEQKDKETRGIGA